MLHAHLNMTVLTEVLTWFEDQWSNLLEQSVP